MQYCLLKQVTLGRRSLLGSLVSLLPLLLDARVAPASLLRSQASEKPCTLTFLNKTSRNIKVYWNNYDADKEFFALVPPNGEYTIDSYAVSPLLHRQFTCFTTSFRIACKLLVRSRYSATAAAVRYDAQGITKDR